MNNISTKDVRTRPLTALAAALVLVGALNWGLVAIAEFDLVAWIFGEQFGSTNVASRIVYGLVGLAGVCGIAALLGARRHTGTHQAATAAH